MSASQIFRSKEKTFYVAMENGAEYGVTFNRHADIWVDKMDFHMGSLAATIAGLEDRMIDGVYYRWVVRWHMPNIHDKRPYWMTTQAGAGLVPVDGVVDGEELVARDADTDFTSHIRDEEFIPIIDFTGMKGHLLDQYIRLAICERHLYLISWFTWGGPMIRGALNKYGERLIEKGFEKEAPVRRRLPPGFDPTRRMPGIYGRKPDPVRRTRSGQQVNLRLV